MTVQPLARAEYGTPDTERAAHQRRLERFISALTANPDLIDQPCKLFSLVGGFANSGAEVDEPADSNSLDSGEVA